MARSSALLLMLLAAASASAFAQHGRERRGVHTATHTDDSGGLSFASASATSGGAGGSAGPVVTPFMFPMMTMGFMGGPFNNMFRGFFSQMQQQMQQAQQQAAAAAANSFPDPGWMFPEQSAPGSAAHWQDLGQAEPWPGGAEPAPHPGAVGGDGGSGVVVGGGGGGGGGGNGYTGAQASLAVDNKGGFGQASLFPDPNLSTRIAGDIPPLSGQGTFGVFSSSSSSSSNINGRRTSFKEATVGVNDNGKVKVFSVKDP